MVLLQLDTTSREERRIPTLLGGLDCTGDENSLLDCPGAVLGEGSVLCSVAEAVSVICFNQLDASTMPMLQLHSMLAKPTCLNGAAILFPPCRKAFCQGT